MGSKLSPQPQQSNPMVSKIFIFSSTTNFKSRVFHTVWKINNFSATQSLCIIHFDNYRAYSFCHYLFCKSNFTWNLAEKLLIFHTVMNWKISTALCLGVTTFDTYLQFQVHCCTSCNFRTFFNFFSIYFF